MNILCFTKCLKDRVDRKTDNSKSDYDLLVRLVLFFGRPEPESFLFLFTADALSFPSFVSRFGPVLDLGLRFSMFPRDLGFLARVYGGLGTLCLFLNHQP